MTRLKTILYAVAIPTVLYLFSGFASAQTISIVSGNGQLVCSLCPIVGLGGSYDPLVVQVKDALGNPVAGVVVTWTVINGAGATATVGQITTITGADGTSSNTFFLSPPFGVSFLQATVTASIATSSVQFTETAGSIDPSTSVSAVQISLVSPPVGTSFSGPAGSISSTLIQVNAFAPRGGFVAGVEVKLVPVLASQTSNVTCAAGTTAGSNSVLTNAAGDARCNVFFGGTPGSGQFNIVVGGKYNTFGPFSFTVTSGLPGAIVLTSGNGQQGNAGSALPAPLVATVQDLAGNALAGVDVTWTVTQGAATLTSTRPTSDANGRVSTNVTLGSTAGPVQIKVAINSAPTVSATFTATVLLTITSIQKLSGDPQEAVVSTPFPNPLVVQVNNGAQPVAGITVQFTVTSGSATPLTASAITAANGQAQTLVQAGVTAGPVVIVASVAGFAQTVTFNLTVRPPGPAITSNNFFNGASGRQGDISPCSVATVTGTALAPGLQGAVVPNYPGPWPFQVANVTIRFHDSSTNRDLDAPIYSVANINSQESVTFEVPCDLTPGSQTVNVRVGSGNVTVNVQVQAVAPGMFQTVLPDGNRRAIVVKSDGTLVWAGNPARPRETLRLYMTGPGPVTPSIITNQVGGDGIQDLDSKPNNQVVVGVGNEGTLVRFARYARGFVGVYEVEFDVPETATTNNASPLGIAVVVNGNFIFGAGSAVAILQ